MCINPQLKVVPIKGTIPSSFRSAKNYSTHPFKKMGYYFSVRFTSLGGINGLRATGKIEFDSMRRHMNYIFMLFHRQQERNIKEHQPIPLMWVHNLTK